MISGALFYERVTRSMQWESWIRLYVSRIFRIIPLYWFSVLFVVFIFLTQGLRFKEEDLMNLFNWLILYKITSIMGEEKTGIPLNIAWTLWYEWIFYLVLPSIWVISIFLKNNIVRIFLLILAILIAGLMPLNLPWALHLFLAISPYFFIGMLAVEIGRFGKVRSLLLSRTAGMIAIVAFVIEVFSDGEAFPGRENMLTFLFLALVFFPVYFGSLSLSFLKLRPFVALGEWSFGVYLLHNCLHYIFFQILGFSNLPTSVAWLSLPLSTSATIIFAAICHNLIERPFMRFGAKLSKTFAAIQIERG